MNLSGHGLKPSFCIGHLPEFYKAGGKFPVSLQTAPDNKESKKLNELKLLSIIHPFIIHHLSNIFQSSTPC